MQSQRTDRRRLSRGRLLLCVCLCLVALPGRMAIGDPESLWIEAEHMVGIKGYCWPMGRPAARKTDGNWGLSGPGWAAEWNQGGESGFLSIAAGVDEGAAVVTKSIEIPVDGDYSVWVRYGDWREKREPFEIRIEQAGSDPWSGRYGEKAVIEEDNVMKLYFGWAFGWDSRSAQLRKGEARLSLAATAPAPEPRQVDVLVLTTDKAYRPQVKERPHSATWDVLDTFRNGLAQDLEPLARQRPSFKLPADWELRTFRDKGFLYLWNVSSKGPEAAWLGEDPERVMVPYNVRDKDVREAFEEKYARRSDVPILSDPRIVPTFHGSGPGIFTADPETGELLEPGRQFAKWLDTHPDRPWAMMMNYHPDKPIGEEGIRTFQKYRDRYVGSISGESLGYFYPEPEAMKVATTDARTRRELVDAFGPLTVAGNSAKYKKVYGTDLDDNPYGDVISCLSVGNIVFAPLLAQWGVRTLGYESSAATSSMLGMRWAFIRGAARQHARLTATYRSCNFGDSATMFSDTMSYHSPKNIYDNYYSVYSGAGMTWYKMDIWYQYMAGSSMFYHEQGFDEFWMPGGTSAAGRHPVQLSPKGKLVDRFLRVTAKEQDRGHPFTPVAFLVDYAHGWEPSPYWPNSFKNWHQHQERFLYGDHEKMLEEYLWVAYHPIGPKSQEPITAVNEVYVPGVFGDMFDVIFAYPDPEEWRTIQTYPAVIAAGEIELSAAEGKRLARYVEDGGTLLVADGHLTGPGVDALDLPKTGPDVEAASYGWLEDSTDFPSQRFRCRPITLPKKARALAVTPEGQPFCVAIDRGKGRLIYLSVSHGLGIDRRALPVVARLVAHLSRGLMPIEVDGDVQWLVNRTEQGWIVTLLNPAGQRKPQQGLFPTDYRENRNVTIRSRVPIGSARDWLLPGDDLAVQDNRLQCEVAAGGVRVIELR